MHLPKLRIAHQLTLLLAGSAVLAVLVVGGLSVWNLQRGFSEYLRLRDEDQLTTLVTLVERRATQDPSMDWLRDNREAMRSLMDELAGREARAGRADRPPPGPPRDGALPERMDRLDPGRGPPQPQPPMPGNLPQRVMIRDAQGARLAGRAPAPGAPVSVRAVKVHGQEVATIELALEAKPEGVDARFLQRQYTGVGVAAGGTMLLAVITAWWFGRRWSRPLRALQAATRRIARGELDVSIQVGDVRGAIHSGALEIEQLITDVNAMALALAGLEQARRTWIAEISHELRTPLAVLRGELESIEDGAREPGKEVIQSLREEVMQLTRLVDDLHVLAVSDIGQMPCNMEAGDANAALLRSARRFEVRAGQLGLRLEIQSQESPITAVWDFGRIDQMLSNVLENSLRYTHAPGHIRVHWRQGATTLTFQVQDSAPGVASQDLTKLFEPLFRGDAARTRTGQHGSGLGLSIVQAIVRAHRGTVAAKASPLGGVAIEVVLPLQPERLERRKGKT